MSRREPLSSTDHIKTESFSQPNYSYYSLIHQSQLPAYSHEKLIREVCSSFV